MPGPRWTPARWQLALINAAIVLAIMTFAWWRYRSPEQDQEAIDQDKAARLAAQEKERAEKERAEIARLTAMLDDPGMPRRIAVDRLAKYGPKARPAVQALIRRAKDSREDVDVRNSAIYVLAAIGPDAAEAVELLIELLKTGTDWATRSLAARALGEIESKAALGPLREALNDENKEVRDSARGAIGKIEGK